MQRLWRLVKSEQSEIRNVYIFALFQGVVNLTLPLGIQAIINLLQAGELRASWIVLVIFVILGVFFNGLLQLRQMAITEAIEQRLFVKSSFDFAYRLPRASFDSVKSKYFPEVMNRFFETLISPAILTNPKPAANSTLPLKLDRSGPTYSPSLMCSAVI